MRLLLHTPVKPACRLVRQLIGGSGEIRTHGRVTPSPVFKTGPFNHSGTLPFSVWHAVQRGMPYGNPILSRTFHLSEGREFSLSSRACGLKGGVSAKKIN